MNPCDINILLLLLLLIIIIISIIIIIFVIVIIMVVVVGVGVGAFSPSSLSSSLLLSYSASWLPSLSIHSHALPWKQAAVGRLLGDCSHGLLLKKKTRVFTAPGEKQFKEVGPPSEKELFVLWSEDHYSALALCKKKRLAAKVTSLIRSNGIHFCNPFPRSMGKEGHVPQTTDL